MVAQANPAAMERLWGRIIAQAWSDEDFKQALIDDPHSVLAEYGIDVPAGVAINVVEDTETVRHIVLPPRPDDLTDEPLSGDGVAWVCGACGRCGCGCARCRC